MITGNLMNGSKDIKRSKENKEVGLELHSTPLRPMKITMDGQKRFTITIHMQRAIQRNKIHENPIDSSNDMAFGS